MKKVIILIPAVFLFVLVILAVLSFLSMKMPEKGLVNGRLRPCPASPNCVCSEYQDKSFVEPLYFNESWQEAWERARDLLEEMGGRLEIEEQGYLRAVFTTRIFRFRDDVELRMKAEKSRIHIRSSSRVGHSDFGQNRRRVKKIRAGFNQKQE
jgi:uncharacterized protein (DUF1499 family)